MTTDNSNKTPANKQDLRLLMRLLPFIRPYKKMVMGAALALIITACVSLALGQGIRLLVDQGFDSTDPSRLNQAMLVLAVITLLMAAGTFTRFYLVSWLGERVSNDVRLAVFNHLLTLDPYYFEMNRSGEINARLTTDTTLLQSIIGSSISMALRSSLTFVGGLVMMLITNPKLALIVLASVPLIIFPMIIYGRRVRKLSRQSQDRVADIGTYAGEIVQNIKIVQSFTHEAEETKAFGLEVEKAFNVAKKRILQRSILIVVAMTLVFTGLSSMIWVGAQDVASGHISSGELAAFIFYALMVAMAVATISEVYGELQRAAGATERLLELLAEQADISAPEDAVPLANGPLALSFDRVSFSYPSRPDQAALENISFNVSAGETVAIVGPSGAGKSTLFELLQRFYDPKNGNIKVSGHDIKQLKPQDLRSHLGLVPQQPTLFSADVTHNIRYGDPSATQAQVQQAAQKAYADEFIDRLPEAYSSYLGEQGVRLSGGQRQRIAIARAMLKNPSILLLDEATSALDANSEHKVQAALKELMHGRTTLIIAHRLATVMHADRIMVFNEGKLEAEGKHEDLIATSSLYKRLSELQFNH
ncbi:ABC transporter transmembrane domain-containing protein [Candidatus Njordibacter sp. Uisw_039]|jgi:ATP-binding cassette subfamily B protein|uniref:ABC transporter transmembrane domain-containing protein n=1 Tax=Candidatus Njordibacter sp. Uisw_039 TaxID=3230972 RepID=UPI003A3E6509|tara:strand:+ start:7063 stop:8835 length:1773 start_codon:yes stop_codon:yes gene_type:complete